MAGGEAFELPVRFTSQSALANSRAEKNGVARRHATEKVILRRAHFAQNHAVSAEVRGFRDETDQR